MAVSLQKLKEKYGIVGNSEGLMRALEVAVKVASTDMSVLIIGESGTGKDVLPRVIHDLSKRKGKKYFAINCGSIPEGTIDSELFGHEKGSFTGAVAEHNGYFGIADGGTLFLDEVGELPVSTQARLLRVLENGEYIRVGGSEVRKTNVRIVAATNIDMKHAIQHGRFRQDLYFRLNTIPIKIPPLRERAEDIVLLFKKFALETAEKYQMSEPIRLTDEAAQCMMRYHWPGNIRELKNITEKLSVLMVEKRIVTPDEINIYVPELASYDDNSIVTMAGENDRHDYEVEREIIFKMLLELHADVEALKKMTAKPNDSRALELKEEFEEYVET